jgi:hypothetical protein
MASNKKWNKMFLRYDGLGVVVSGSNILAPNKPKLGRWVEIATDECCSGCIPIYVCNAGTVGANGLYTCAGMVNNKPFYTKGDYRLSWGEYPIWDGGYYDEWDIWDVDMNPLYYTGGNDNTPTPVTAEYWITEDGINPAPTVQLELCDPYSCLCESVLTVGGNGRSVWGYLIESYGSLTPNCSSVLALVYFTGEGSALILVSSEYVKDCMVVTIDGTDYELQYSYQSPYGYEYVLLNGDNPFPEIGSTSVIVIDCDVDCSTTTTTTTCEVPAGMPISGATSITALIGGSTIEFNTSEENACIAAGLMNLYYLTQWDWNDRNIILVSGEPNLWYDSANCGLCNGFYMVNDTGDFVIYEFLDGEVVSYNICPTTTTTTTSGL